MAAVNDVGSSQQMTEKTEGKTAYEENIQSPLYVYDFLEKEILTGVFS